MSPTHLAWRIWALAVVLFIVAPIACAQAPAGGLIFDCNALAEGIRSAAIYRDVGADLGKTIAFYRTSATHPEPRKEVVEREIRRMWREGLPPAEAGFAVYRRCQAQHGDMGRET